MQKFALRRLAIAAIAPVALFDGVPLQAAPEPSAETQQLLQEAASACQRNEFYEFLEAFIASSNVRARYRDAPSEPFGIGKVDFSYVEPRSVDLSNPDPNKRFREFAVDVTELAGKGRRVTYQPGIFLDDGEGDGKTLVRRTGKPSSYTFAWKNGCWRLTR